MGIFIRFALNDGLKRIKRRFEQGLAHNIKGYTTARFLGGRKSRLTAKLKLQQRLTGTRSNFRLNGGCYCANDYFGYTEYSYSILVIRYLV
jgi:hypothetical protein